MPSLFSPRITTPAFSSKSLPGIQVPGNANTDFMPLSALGAPHTTSISVPVPASTLQTLRWSELGCGTAETTLATTNGRSALP